MSVNYWQYAHKDSNKTRQWLWLFLAAKWLTYVIGTDNADNICYGQC